MKKFRTILIDGDLLLHRVSSATERQVDWGNGLHTLHTHEDDAKNLVDKLVAGYVDVLAAEKHKVIIAFSSDTNFRKEIYPDYKGNRRGRKPLGYLAVKAHIEAKYETKTVEGLEADDVLGILATMRKTHDPVIVSDDKDFKQIPGHLYRPSTGELLATGVEEGDRYHLHQSLCGDRVDNYPGCPGVGEVKAGAILRSAGEGGNGIWDAVCRAYEGAGLTEADALTQARLARILRSSDYDFKNRRPILWQPSAPTVTVKSKSPATASKKRGSATRSTKRKSATTATSTA